MKRIVMISAAAIAVLAMILSVSAAPSDGDDKSFDVTYTLKDVTRTVHFDGPVDKVVVFGYAAALTVIDTGKIDKLYACDKYGDDAFSESKLARNCKTIANLSSSNVDLIYSTLVQAVDAKEFSKDDAVILTTMTTAAENVRSKLAEAGFTHVIFYGSMEEYGDIVQCVKEIEQIVGSEKNLHKNMEYVYDKVSSALKNEPKKDALFVWYTPSSGWGYGNTGSLSVSLINAGGGNNLGYNAGSKEGIIYDKSGVVQRLESSPECVIFLDSGYIRSYGGSVDKFVSEVMGGDQGKHKICIVEHAWNNYDPESADGLWSMASVMHPDKISGDVPVYEGSGSGNDNTLLYIGIAAAIVIIAAIAIFFVRSR